MAYVIFAASLFATACSGKKTQQESVELKKIVIAEPLHSIGYLPLYIGQLFQLSYGLIDTRIIGSVLGEKSLAAVGTTTSLSDLLVEFLNGIACGFGIIVSTFVGAQDETKMK